MTRKFSMQLIQTNDSGSWLWTIFVRYNRHTIFESTDASLADVMQRASDYILEYLDKKSS